MKIIIIAILSLATCCFAQDKMTVSLNEGSYSTSGGAGREEGVKLEFRKEFSSKPIPVEEKIAALKGKLHFYELTRQYKVDLSKEINAVYTDKPLKSVLAELLPNVPVKFDGVDSGVTIESMAVAKTPLETVCDYLDAAAGVYFQFTDQGITVTAKPAGK
jgi:hypothetical protein